MVEYIIAIDVTRVQFPELFLHGRSLRSIASVATEATGTPRGYELAAAPLGGGAKWRRRQLASAAGAAGAAGVATGCIILVRQMK